MTTKATIFIFAVLMTIAITSCATWHRDIRKANVDDVYVDIGSPRHWTLEDAHYLLAGLKERMHDLDIKGPEELNPNAVNSIQLQSVQTVTDLAVKYDEIAALQNRNTLSNYEQAQSQQQVLRNRIKQDSLKASSLREELYKKQLEQAEKNMEVNKKQVEIDAATREKISIEIRLDGIRTPRDDEPLSDAEIAHKEKLKKDLDEKKTEIDGLNDTLKILTEERTNLQSEYNVMKAEYDFVNGSISADTAALSPDTLSLTTTPSPGVSTPPSALLNEMFSSAITTALNDDKNDAAPKLHISEMLANYINAENELLARQLTMIKSDIGEDNTLLFLEFPHSIDAVEGDSSERKVQIRWRVKEVCLKDPTAELVHKIKQLEGELDNENQQSQDNNGHEINNAQLDSKDRPNFDVTKYAIGPTDEMQSISFGSDVKLLNRQFKFDSEEAKTNKELADNIQTLLKTKVSSKDEREDLIVALENEIRRLQKDKSTYVAIACSENTDSKISENNHLKLVDPKGHVVAWDLIPKSDKFNITSQSFESNSFNLSALFTLVTGIGGQASFQKRKELFQQIAAQQSLSSAFGQGNSEFGWILNPRLGTTTVSQGATTTYASLIAPMESTVLKLQSDHCILSSGQHIGAINPMQCSNSKKEHIIVVNHQKGFWVNDIDYGLVKSGEVATVIIEGEEFYPNQLSVLIDGIPMTRFSTSQIQTSGVSSNIGEPGSFEIMNSKELILKIKMPPDYEGTPQITLVTPRKTKTLNYLNVRLGILGNKVSRISWQDKMPMFQKAPNISQLSVKKVNDLNVRIKIEGEGFYNNSTLFVNGIPYKAVTANQDDNPQTFKLLSNRHIELHANLSDEFRVYLSNKLAGQTLSAFASTSHLEDKVGEISVTSLEIIRANKIKGSQSLHFVAKGNNFEKPTVNDITGSSKISNVKTINKELLYFEVATDDDSIPIEISQRNKSVLNVVAVPKIPRITTVSKSGGTETFGLTTGGYTIIVKGENFANVSSVLIDNKLATIVAKSDSIIEITPPVNITSGKKNIILKTDAEIRGTRVSNVADLSSSSGIFEFKEPPKSEDPKP